MSARFPANHGGQPALRGIRVRLILTIALASLSGCGEHSTPATVEGTLRLNGKPLDNCLITFLPEPGQEAMGPHSTAVTDRQGAYRLRFDNQQEGAAVGRHRVTVQDLSASSGLVRRDHGTVDSYASEHSPAPRVRPSRVPQAYMSSNHTPLWKEVKAGYQAIDLDIK